MPTLSRHDSVFVLRFSELMDSELMDSALMDAEPTATGPTDEPGNPENVFSPDLLDSLDAALDEVEASEGPAALVTTGSGRFYSNGLDLGIITSDPARLSAYVTRVQRLFARVLRLELPTVAAVNGHAFGAGTMLALSHDHRVMRSDRGYWNLPEATLGMPFPAGMNALVTTRLGHPVAATAMLTAHRYPAADAVSAGIVHESADAESVLDRSVAVAAELAPLRGPNYAGIRAGLVAGILPHLDAPVERL